MDNAFGFVVSRKDTILRYVVAMPLLLPGAFLLVFAYLTVVTLMGFIVVGPDMTLAQIGRNGLSLLAMVSWVVLVFWATATDSIRRTIARACWAFSTGGFLLPVGGFVSLSYGPPDPPDHIITKGVVLLATLFIGVPIGLVMIAAAKLTAPEGSPERSAWYAFKPIGGAYFALAVGLLFFVAMVLHLFGWEGFL